MVPAPRVGGALSWHLFVGRFLTNHFISLCFLFTKNIRIIIDSNVRPYPTGWYTGQSELQVQVKVQHLSERITSAACTRPHLPVQTAWLLP
jgi:hypothetical protein